MRTMRNLLAKKAVVTVLAVGVSLAAVNAFWGGSDSALSQLGSSGSEVRAIQERLKERGLFNDSVTGYYGEKTKSRCDKISETAGDKSDGNGRSADASGVGHFYRLCAVGYGAEHQSFGEDNLCRGQGRALCGSGGCGCGDTQPH